MSKKVTLPQLTIDNISAVYLDVDDLCEALKEYLSNYTDEDKRT